jgi:hypothetical protein
MGRGIYVEVLIRSDLDTVWHYSQDPARHQRWDLRFLRSSPRCSPARRATRGSRERPPAR